MGKEGHRNSEHRGTEAQWANRDTATMNTEGQRHSGQRGTQGSVATHRDSGHSSLRGTVATDSGQRPGTVGTQGQ